MPNYKKGLGPKGMGSMKKEKFIEQYQWQLKDYGHQRKNTIVGMTLQDYYDLNLFCIEKGLSATVFMRFAIKERVQLCKLGLIEIDENNGDKIKKSIKKQNIKIKKLENQEGNLFNE